MNRCTTLAFLAAAILLTVPASVSAARAKGILANPGFTQGAPIPNGFKHDWILEETPLKIATPKGMSEAAARRQAANQLRKELEQDDLDRSVKEAEATLVELKPLLDKANADREKRNAEAGRKEGVSPGK